MSLDVWLKSGRTVEVGGRELQMMPLPLSRLFSIGKWLEENSNDVIQETIASTKPGEIPKPLVLVTRVLSKIDVSQLAYEIFSHSKNPETGEPINKNLSKEFFENYLDIPTAHSLFKTFVELNELEDLIKNLQSLPVVGKLMEAASLTFGIPFLSSLQQNMASAQSKLEGSPSPKSTDSSVRNITEQRALGSDQVKSSQTEESQSLVH